MTPLLDPLVAFVRPWRQWVVADLVFQVLLGTPTWVRPLCHWAGQEAPRVCAKARSSSIQRVRARPVSPRKTCACLRVQRSYVAVNVTDQGTPYGAVHCPLKQAKPGWQSL